MNPGKLSADVTVIMDELCTITGLLEESIRLQEKAVQGLYRLSKGLELFLHTMVEELNNV